MSKPMTAEEARITADRMDAVFSAPKLTGALRAYADMLNSQSGDVRDAIKRELGDYYSACALLVANDGKGVTVDVEGRVDRIMALFPQGVKVKALDWRDGNAANTPFGLYWVIPKSIKNLEGEWFFSAPVTEAPNMHPTRDAAKAAAQAHYDAAIRQAIEPQDVSGLVEALKNMRRFALSKMDDQTRARDMAIFKNADAALSAYKGGE